jgi:hypothetical protein
MRRLHLTLLLGALSGALSGFLGCLHYRTTELVVNGWPVRAADDFWTVTIQLCRASSEVGALVGFVVGFALWSCLRNLQAWATNRRSGLGRESA